MVYFKVLVHLILDLFCWFLRKFRSIKLVEQIIFVKFFPNKMTKQKNCWMWIEKQTENVKDATLVDRQVMSQMY